MLYGFDLNSQTKLDELVHGGGMIAILKMLIVISLAGFMNGILNKASLLSPIVNRLMGDSGNPGCANQQKRSALIACHHQ